VLADIGFDAVEFATAGVETVFAFAAVLAAAGFFDVIQVPPGFALRAIRARAVPGIGRVGTGV